MVGLWLCFEGRGWQVLCSILHGMEDKGKEAQMTGGRGEVCLNSRKDGASSK